MNTDGEIDTQEEATGEYRWTYVSAGGAMRLGPRLYKTKKGALAAGERWLEQQQKR